MKKALLGSGLTLLTVAAMQTEIGVRAELLRVDHSQELAQAIGAELIREKDPTDAASTPKPNSETQSAPPTPEIQPEEAPPKPAVSDTTV